MNECLILTHIVRYWQIPYYWAGCKMYDVLAGKENMESSYLMTRGKALEAFPMLKQEGLVGAVVYYDGERPPVFALPSISLTHNIQVNTTTHA